MRALPTITLVAWLASSMTARASCFSGLGAGYRVGFPEVPLGGGEIDLSSPLVVAVTVNRPGWHDRPAVSDPDAIAALTRVVVLPACENGWLAARGQPTTDPRIAPVLVDLAVEPRREARVGEHSWGEANVSLEGLRALPGGDYHVVAIFDAVSAGVAVSCEQNWDGRGLHVHCDDGRCHVLTRSSDGTEHGYASRTGDSPAAERREFVVHPTAWARGRVQSLDGQPIAGASLRACIPTLADDLHADCQDVTTVSAPDGSFQLPVPTPIRDAAVSCFAKGWQRVEAQPLANAPLTFTLIPQAGADVRLPDQVVAPG